MMQRSVIFRLFSRRPLDRAAASGTLSFLIDYEGGIVRPDECGVYEPFEPFTPSAFDRYADWLQRPGGEFDFRKSTGELSCEGQISNLLFPDIQESIAGSGNKTALPPVPPPVFCTRWSLRLEASLNGLDASLMKRLFLDACHESAADYAFVADARDYRAKHFTSVREGNSQVQQYLGDDPEHGIPGLYWLNFFGRPYAQYFGAGKLSLAAHLSDTVRLPGGAFLLQFGTGPEESAGDAYIESQRKVIATLGDSSFFDVRRPARTLLPVPSLSDRS
jgi:hypothetical protein